MIARHIVRSLGSAVVLAASGVAVSALSTSVIPSASAQCPDVQVVFARGTGEAPGVGPTGQAFVDSLRRFDSAGHGIWRSFYRAVAREAGEAAAQ